MTEKQEKNKSKDDSEKNFEDKFGQLCDALSAVGEAVYIWDTLKDHVEWYGDVDSIFYIEETEDNKIETGLDFNILINPQDLPERLRVLNMRITGEEVNPRYECDYRLKQTNGTYIWIREQGKVSFENSGRVPVLHGVLKPLSDEAVKRKKMEEVRCFDALTGHYNRVNLRDFLDVEIERANKLGKSGCFIAVGIDRISMFNEVFGSNVTDSVIAGVGQRLEGLICNGSAIGRIAGDVFGVILPNVLEHDLASMTNKILASLCSFPIMTPSGPIRVSVSIGGVSYPQKDDDKAMDIMTKAESALHIAKKQGRGCYIPYNVSDKDRTEYKECLETGDAVLTALDGNRLVLAYQPVVDPIAQKTIFYECLVRMITADGDILNAGQFIPAVEKLGLARMIDKYTLKLAVEELRLYPDISFSVNVSGWTLNDVSWMRQLVSLLYKSPNVANRLIFEITETVAIQDMKQAVVFVNTLKSLGCEVALDDFGTGHTSFGQIQSLDLDIVKIDKSFVRDLADNKESQLFVKTLQELSNGFGMRTVGEGAESQEDVDVLVGMGVDLIQGYFYGFPSIERVWLPKDHPNRISVDNSFIPVQRNIIK